MLHHGQIKQDNKNQYFKRMKRVLYLMHVPWGWIKQRPHFFAEYLAKDCMVDVYYKQPIFVSNKGLLNSKENKNNLVIKGFRQIPFDKIPLIKHLNLNWINNIMLYKQLPNFEKYDYVWFTCPSMYQLFAHRLKSSNVVVYDCMDDILEFPFCKSNIFFAEKMLIAEKNLILKSSKIFCSSDYLKNKILKRANCNKKVVIVNNAIEPPAPNAVFKKLPNNVYSILNILEQHIHSLLYIGTISQWFDFTLIIEELNTYKDLHLILIGPSDVQIPAHPHIHYLGTVERNYIFLLMKRAWCLIMPFQVNELIRSVNPVKLYEYIYMGKHVIAPKYGETIKFADYINLYDSENDFTTILKQIYSIKELDRQRQEKMKLFAESNTWENRYQIIRKELNI